MKLRCVENSIRLRLRRSELVQLQQEGFVRETVSFPNGSSLSFILKTDPALSDMQAVFVQDEISIILPPPISDPWMTTNQVGIEKTLSLPEDRNLHILIEKDFPCTDREDEDKNDTFWELANQKAESC